MDSNTKTQIERSNSRKAVPIYKLFRYASSLDILFYFIGSLAALCSGAIMPLSMLFLTNIVDSFTNYGSQNCNQTSSNFENISNQTNDFNLSEKLGEQSIYLVEFAVVAAFLSYLRITFWVVSAERQSRMIRKMLFNSILAQEISWFDSKKSGELTNRLANDIDQIKEGMGDKFSNFIQLFATFFSGMLISLIKGWKLTIVILSLSPLLFICSVVFTKITESLSKNELKSYSNAAAVAEEALSAIKTVFAFNGSQIEHKRYESNLDESRRFGIKKGLITGFLFAVVSLVTYSTFSLGFWYGWTLTIEEDYTVGKIMFIFYSIIQAVSSLGNAVPFITNLAQARGAAYEVFKLIDKKPEVNSNSGEKLTNLQAEIEFKNVFMSYPSQPEVKVLNDINFKIKPGSTVAFVGSSGSGKSSCIQLLQRFYEPNSGHILIDNKELRSLNLEWFRTRIGVVSQEANLFSSTIYENIKYGREDATEMEILEAAKQANAHEFIMKLPMKYQTQLGNKGGQLSGGQKQRIAIARALVRNPKILLLDEATSALDNMSESLVQTALDKARIGRTTIIVAHRLSTIRNVDMIYCLDKGSVIESGTHDQLMNLKGKYYSLVISQQVSQTKRSESITKKAELENCLSNETDESKPRKFSEFELIEYSIKDYKNNKINLMRVLALNKPEWFFILIGCVGCIVSGVSNPIFSAILSKVISVFEECDYNLQKSNIKFYCIIFLIIGGITFISNFLLNVMFAISGENLTKRLRSSCFKAMLSQDLEWFDMPENSVGSLTTRLAAETSAVQKATGFRIGIILMNLSNLGIAILLAFITSWTISLTIIAFVPLMFLSAALQTKLISGYVSREKQVLEDAGKLSSEVISNIKTVAILNKQSYFSTLYAQMIDSSYKDSIKLANINGFMIGFISSIMVFAISAAFVLGGYLVENKLFDLNFEKIMRVFSSLFYGAQSVTEAANLMPDYAKAKVAIKKIFELLDRTPKINNWPNENSLKTNQDGFSTNIQFDAVDFSYPNRIDINVLNNFNLKIKQGQRVALVGPSGSGKSTLAHLLERFYDPSSGEIKIGNTRLKDYDLNFLRSKIGIVSQETVLFDKTIAENIAYGDNSRQIELNEVIEAAKRANIHEFISNLPMGYHSKTGQLSGGQKQRICIARALVKNPQILILDEATSALDAESEKLVQAALEEAQKGRTCITIAHRLSTIKHSDVIYVLDKHGVVIEKGTHEDLLKQQGFYATLNSLV